MGYCTALYCTIQYCTVLKCCQSVQVYQLKLVCFIPSVAMYCTVLYCTVLYCTVLNVLYCTVLYCTALYYTEIGFKLAVVRSEQKRDNRQTTNDKRPTTRI